MARINGYVTVPNTDGNPTKYPNFESWIDLALDKSMTIQEKMEMLLAMADYADSLPEDCPRWPDGRPIIPGQIAVSWHGPMMISEIRDGYLYSKGGYIIDGFAGDRSPSRMFEYQYFWPDVDEHFADHVWYYEATGTIAPQCEGGKASFELEPVIRGNYDPRLPDGAFFDPIAYEPEIPE